jgi:GNAT superfamily N-acetyltransferase
MIRPVRPDDAPFLKRMIYEGTFHEAIYPPGRRPSLEEALADLGVARFVKGWDRPGDFGVVAIDDERPVGAAWCCLFGKDDPGWTIDDKTPDMAIAVVPDQRGRAWGGKLIAELLKMARRKGFEAMSLNVGSGIVPQSPCTSVTVLTSSMKTTMLYSCVPTCNKRRVESRHLVKRLCTKNRV